MAKYNESFQAQGTSQRSPGASFSVSHFHGRME